MHSSVGFLDFESEEGHRILNNPKIQKLLFVGFEGAGKSSLIDNVFNDKVIAAKAHKVDSKDLDARKTAAHAPKLFRTKNSDFCQNCVLSVTIGNTGTPLFEEHMDFVLSIANAVIFVIDIQPYEYSKELEFCRNLFSSCAKNDSKKYLGVFIHKVDGDFYSLDAIRCECQKSIHDRLLASLDESGVSTTIHFFSTSVFDCSSREAASRVLQSLMPESPTLQEIIDIMAAKSKMQRVYLIDSNTKLLLSSDTSPFDPYNFELSAELIEVILEISLIYGTKHQDHINQRTSFATLQINNGLVLYVQELFPTLLLCCVFKEEDFDQQYLVEYNVSVFKDVLAGVFGLQTLA